MSNIRKYRTGLLAMLLVAILAMGGLYGCATDSGSSSSDSGSDPPPSGGSGECTGGSLDACNASCEGTGQEIVDCKERCLQFCVPL